MTNVASLKAVLEQAEAARDEAQAALLRVQGELRAAEGQSEQLAQYRREYEERYVEQFRRAAHIEIMRHYQSFMERLTQAIEQQRRVVAHHERRLEQARQALAAADTRLAAIGKLIERRLAELERREARRDQRATDEAAARAAAAGASSRFGRFSAMSASFQPTR